MSETARVPVPGVLRGDVRLTLQTREAALLVYGRPAAAGKRSIVGLLAFADRLRTICAAAAADDPYADQWLLRVEARLERARAVLDQATGDMSPRDVEGFAATTARSVAPLRIVLRFATPYAYRSAQLLASFDGVVRQLRSAAHLGLLPHETASRQIQRLAHALRGVFATAQGFRAYGLDRAAVVAGTPAAMVAAAAWGELPADVLNGDRRPQWAPSVRRHPELGDEITDEIDRHDGAG